MTAHWKVLALSTGLALTLAACGQKPAEETKASTEQTPETEGVVTLTAQQITAAGIGIGRPVTGGNALLEIPATIDGDPQATQIASAAIGGRIVTLNRNLGETVRRGDVLAVIESREAAQINGEIEAARARLTLANANLTRERRLFAERVSPEQDLIAARTAAAEAQIALRLAQQQIAAAGGQGGSLNRVTVRAPVSGQIISRNAMLGQTVAADAELFRIANLSTLALTLNVQPADAGQLQTGAMVSLRTAGREGRAYISFISPALDLQTRLVPVIASLDNRDGQWRIGEPVTAAVALRATNSNDNTIQIPNAAVQTVEGRSIVFVRTATGFRATPVTLGARAGDRVIVRSGLTGNESIATSGAFTLKAELGKSEAEQGGH